MRRTDTNQANIHDWQIFCLNVLADSRDKLSISWPLIDDEAGFTDYLKSNGICCLLLDSLEEDHKTALLPKGVVNRLREYRRIQSVKELSSKENLKRTIALLGSSDVDCLILKGSALAYSLYKRPYHRIHGDTDILIRPADKDTVDTLLSASGYKRSVNVSGSLISHQNTYSKTEMGIRHDYDVHWKISNRNAYADLFDFEALYTERRSVPSLGDHASRLCSIDALLHAIIHYYGHYPGDRERLIWVYDIHLLCTRLNPDQWHTFLEKSRQKKLDPLVLDALLLTRKTFRTRLPDIVLRKLMQSPVRLNEIEQRRLTATRWTRIEQFKSDWAVLNFAQRCRLLKEYLLPPGEFILQQNHSTNRMLLPYFYIKRILAGGLSVIRKPRAH